MVWRRALRWLMWAGLACIGTLVVGVFSAPLWLRPLIEREAVGALGRPVSIGTLHVTAGDPVAVTFDDLTIGNPAEFPDGADPFAHIAALRMDIDILASLKRRQLVIASVELDQPTVAAISTQDGRKNYVFPSAHAPVGILKVTDGHAHVVLAGLKADVQMDFATRPEAPPDDPAALVATARGTYWALPVDARLTGGSSVDSGPSAAPWPFTLALTDGQTKISAGGTLRDPLTLREAKVDLKVSGPDMVVLRPIFGVAFIPTPPYTFDGTLDYTTGLYHLTGNAGTIGRSDVEGDVIVDETSAQPPNVTANLRSGAVSLADLASLLRDGEAPAGPTPTRVGALPQSPLQVPKFAGGQLHLAYQAQRVEGPALPFNDLDLHLELAAGTLTLRPLSARIGPGSLTASLVLSEEPNAVRAQSDLRLDHADLARLLRGTGVAGAGALSGAAHMDGTGPSVAALLGAADGGATLWMDHGDLSALLVDLGGLRLGRALLADLVGPRDTAVQCFAADLPLHHGVVSTRALTLETADAITQGRGTLDLVRERIDILLRTQSRHLTVGVIPEPLRVGGSLAEPTVMPDPRAAAGQGALADVLSVLPTIQLGAHDEGVCAAELRRVRRD